MQHHHGGDAGDVDVRDIFLAAALGQDALHEIGAHGADGCDFDFRIGFLKRAGIEHQWRAPMVERQLAFLLRRLDGLLPFAAGLGGFGGGDARWLANREYASYQQGARIAVEGYS